MPKQQTKNRLNLQPDGLLEIQREIMLEAHREIWQHADAPVSRKIHLAGSYRGGKSVGAIDALGTHGMLRGGGTYFLVGVSRDSFLNACLLYLREWAQYAGLPLTTRGYTINTGPIEWIVLGATDERSAKRVQGATADGGLLDEVAEYPKSFYDMVLTRLSVEGSLLITTCNPAEPRHWFKVEVLDRAKETGDIVLESARGAIYKNHYLPADYVAGLEARLPDHLKARGMAGVWTPAEGLVYPDVRYWDRRLPPRAGGAVMGLDYGAADNGTTAGVVITWHKPPEAPDGIYIASSEYSHRGPLDSNVHAERICRGWPDAGYVVDPSPAPLYQALLSRAPRKTQKADKEAGSVLEGIYHITALMQAGRLYIGDCPELRRELLEYVWSDIVAPVTGADRPVKQYDHWCDALRYSCQHIRPEQEVRYAANR